MELQMLFPELIISKVSILIIILFKEKNIQRCFAKQNNEGLDKICGELEAGRSCM